MSNCPKCGEKLSAFYFKQTCPKCGANLMYYDFENNLKKDAEQAARETQAVERLLSGLKASAIGSVFAILRLVCFVLSIAALLLPVFKANGDSVNLIGIIKSVIGGGVFGDTLLTLCFADFVCVVAFALVCVVVSLFSFTKNGLKRNVVISAAGIAAFAGIYLAVISAGGGLAYGFFIVVALQAAIIALHFAVNGKIKK